MSRNAPDKPPGDGASLSPRAYLTALGDIALAGEVSLDDLLQRIVELAKSLLHARYAALGVFDAQGQVRQFYTAGITAEERARIGPLPVGAGLLGYIVKERRIVRCPRIAGHPAAVGFPPHHPPMTSFLGGPITRGGVIYGNLYLTNHLGASEFSAEDAELLEVLARQSAIAIENAQRFAREQAALRQSEIERSSLSAIFDSLRDAVFTTDLEGRIVRLNRPASAWASAEVIGQPASVAFRLVDEANEDVPPPREGDLSSIQATLIRPNGERIAVERVVAPIRDASGRFLGTVQVLRDLRPHQDVERLKATIISLVSHELRTPLSHIKGYASSLLQPDVVWDAETQRDFIASIEKQADRLGRLIDDLLEISRLDAGGTTRLERVPVTPATLVERGIRQAAPNAGGHPIRVSVPDGLPLILADPSHIERVLSNLIENAAKYSAEDAPIQIDVEGAGDLVAFAVQDRGIGLTPEERIHLFERFYRSPRVKHRTPGTGLGLAICQEIVQAHGGRIWAETGVEGERGSGSVFRFTLPRAATTDQRDGP